MENPSVNDTAEKLSVPPVFVSLTSFTLKRSRANRDSCSPKHNGIEYRQKPASSGTSSDIIETPKYKKSHGAKPWIVYNQPSHDADEIDDEIESERIPTVSPFLMLVSSNVLILVKCIICVVIECLALTS